MKYIKTYEDVSNNNKNWKVNTEMPYFAISLDKIGMPENKQLSMLDPIQYNAIKKYNYVYIGIEYFPPQSKIWTWDEDGYGLSAYQGEIDITQEDIEKWGLNNNVKKYNL